MGKNQSQASNGTSSVLAEIDKLVDELTAIGSRKKAEGSSGLVALRSALKQARRIRKRLRKELRRRHDPDVDLFNVVSFIVRVAELIHSLLNCLLSQKEKYEYWENYKAA